MIISTQICIAILAHTVISHKTIPILSNVIQIACNLLDMPLGLKVSMAYNQALVDRYQGALLLA